MRTENDYSKAGMRGEAEGVGKIQIESHQIARQPKAYLIEVLVRNPAQTFHVDGVGIMPQSDQEVPAGQGKIFVELELHEPVASNGMGMTCSRVISAA